MSANALAWFDPRHSPRGYEGSENSLDSAESGADTHRSAFGELSEEDFVREVHAEHAERSLRGRP